MPVSNLGPRFRSDSLNKSPSRVRSTTSVKPGTIEKRRHQKRPPIYHAFLENSLAVKGPEANGSRQAQADHGAVQRAVSPAKTQETSLNGHHSPSARENQSTEQNPKNATVNGSHRNLASKGNDPFIYSPPASEPFFRRSAYKIQNFPDDVRDKLSNLWKLKSLGEPMDFVEVQFSDTAVTPWGKQVTETLIDNLREYEAERKRLQDSDQLEGAAELELNDNLYYSYSRLSTASLRYSVVVLMERTLRGDLHDFQMLQLERYMTLYGAYTFTDGQISLPELHADFWVWAADRKCRWKAALYQAPGLGWDTMPAKLRDLHKLILEKPADCTALFQYVNRFSGDPIIAGDDDDSSTMITKKQALEDLNMITNRFPPQYSHLIPHFRVAIGSCIEANFWGFYTDCVDPDFRNKVDASSNFVDRQSPKKACETPNATADIPTLRSSPNGNGKRSPTIDDGATASDTDEVSYSSEDDNELATSSMASNETVKMLPRNF
ncbi:uncharacterized protein JN550_004053 [Neoarthrinium moseri]|uniref:uncharacterized protein n=1 Tax=Neoarthrinium moseri TaxID=1658444 RepID=UPI001FDB4571|nr:uncharacterized protein JN550_004053 [Neoarthrinium moseri]KAI1872334.1 hypothetical protein JN550_004053 [Neoarthrinium moseri]